jgi:biopolymer transport protein ExbB
MTRRIQPVRTWLALAATTAVAAAFWTPASRAQTQPPGQSPPAVAEDAGTRAEPVASEDPIPTKDLWSIIADGGPLMIPIALCSLILLTLVFERTISLRRGRVIPKPFVTRFIRQMQDGELERAQALALCEENASPVAEVFAGAVRKWGRPAVEVEQAIIDAGERATNGLRSYLRVFNGIATVSPLLGLLGTVVGMIRAFNAIATSDAMGRPELLANGISQALLTTAAGLSVAIPALICYMVFVSRVDRLIIDIDALGQQLVNAISAEEIQARSQRVKGPKSKRTTPQESAA